MSLTELHFTSDNPTNTKIYNSMETDVLKIIYSVHPVVEKDRVYTVVERAGEELARLEWHDSIVSWKVEGVLPGPTRISNWMKPSIIPFVSTRSFTDSLGRKYKWKRCAPGEMMELWSPDDPSDPIAVYRREIKHKYRHEVARLILGTRALEIQDLIVVSFLFLERENRIRLRASSSRAEAEAAGGAFLAGATANTF